MISLNDCNPTGSVFLLFMVLCFGSACKDNHFLMTMCNLKDNDGALDNKTTRLVIQYNSAVQCQLSPLEKSCSQCVY